MAHDRSVGKQTLPRSRIEARITQLLEKRRKQQLIKCEKCSYLTFGHSGETDKRGTARRRFVPSPTIELWARMVENFFYVYALKDPRSSPALPFYIGKGTGSRAFDYLVRPDQTRKYKRIEEISVAGRKPFVDILVENLTENQALKIEAELIAALGTVETGGPLLNTVVPAGLGTNNRRGIVVPQGSVERAQQGLAMLKKAVLDLVRANPGGITNADVASLLGLRSDYRGRQKDYLSYSVLGLLLREGKIKRAEHGRLHQPLSDDS